MPGTLRKNLLKFDDLAVDILMRRQAAGSKAWARVLASGANTGTMNFYLGLHYYAG